MVTFDVTAAADRFPDALASARLSPVPVTVTADGRPVAVLLSMEAYDGLIEAIAALSDPEAAVVLLQIAADAATRRLAGEVEVQAVPGIEGDAQEVRAAMLGHIKSAVVDARILTLARRAVLAVPMLTRAAVEEAVDVPGVAAQDVAATLRQQGVLIGVPASLIEHQWEPDALVYPAFQIDTTGRRVNPVVAEINQGLGASSDPWAAASWWVTPDPRLGDNRAPLHLVGTDREDDLRVMRGSRLGEQD